MSDELHPTILILDDESHVRRVVSRTLEGKGYACAQAASGSEALKILAERPFELVISDIMMPGMSGLEVLEAARQLRPDIAFIMLTGVDSQKTAMRALDLGAYGYLIKPFEAGALLINVANALRRRDLEKLRDEYEHDLEETVRQRTATICQREAEVLALNAELENRVLRRTHELAMANKELESFSYSVSHDLRRPLRSIDGFSRMLLDDYAGCLDDQGRGYLQRVCNASQRMGQLIDDLLHLSKVSGAEMRLDRVDLGALSRSVAEELSSRSREREVEWAIEDKTMTVSGDSRLLRIALENLIGNALKYTRYQPAPRIEVGCLEQNETQTYFVRDNGAGFDMAYAHKLFGAFQRLHSDKDFEGAGIGLATVQRIIHRHGGRIWAEGKVGEGATFFFTIP
jgi:signal transduction histidine kinase